MSNVKYRGYHLSRKKERRDFFFTHPSSFPVSLLKNDGKDPVPKWEGNGTDPDPAGEPSRARSRGLEASSVSVPAPHRWPHSRSTLLGDLETLRSQASQHGEPTPDDMLRPCVDAEPGNVG